MNIYSPIIQPKSFKSKRIEAIKLVYEPGMSANDIAAALSDRLGEYHSRNAIIGLYHRNKEALSEYPIQRIGGNHAGTKKRKERTIRIARPKPVKTVAPEVEAGEDVAIEPTEYDATALLKTLWELDTRTECKWPVADCEIGTLFCGHESDGTYCHHHRLRSVRRTAA